LAPDSRARANENRARGRLANSFEGVSRDRATVSASKPTNKLTNAVFVRAVQLDDGRIRIFEIHEEKRNHSYRFPFPFSSFLLSNRAQ
jgi:hypothetical protein